jgi:hypothetical protein
VKFLPGIGISHHAWLCRDFIVNVQANKVVQQQLVIFSLFYLFKIKSYVEIMIEIIPNP